MKKAKILLLLLFVLFCQCLKKVEIKGALPETTELNVYKHYFEEGEYSSAVQGLTSFIKKYPESPLVEDAMYFLGEIYLKEENYDKAERYFMDLLKRFPGGDYALRANIRLAVSSIHKGNYLEAQQMLEPLLRIETGEGGRIEYLLGEANFYLKDYYQALLHFRESWRLFDKPEQKENCKKVISELIIPALTTDELKKLVEYFPKDFPGDLLSAELLKRSISAGMVEDSKRYAEMILYYFPEHPSAKYANEILDTIEKHRRTNLKRIGLLIPLSGDYSNYGRRILNGCLHSAGIFSGDEGKDYTIVVSNADGSPLLAEKGVEELITVYNVSAIVGPLFPLSAKASATRAQLAGVPILLLTGEDRLNEIGDYVFSFGLTNSAEAKVIASYAVRELGLKRFAILYPDSEFGKKEMNAFWDEVERFGGKVVGIESYPPQKKEFTQEIKKLVGLYYLDTREEEKRKWLEENKGIEKGKLKKEWKPYPIIDFDAIFIPDTYDVVSIILLYLPYFDILAPIPLGISGWNNPGLLVHARKDAEGSIFPDIFSDTSDRPEVKYFVETFKLDFGETPDRYSALGYDACALIIKAIEEGARSREELKGSLLKLRDYSGVTGRINFLSNGEIRRNFVIFQVKSGKIELIKDGVNP